jgi:hypothetical protein
MEKMSGSPAGPSVRFVFASLPTRMIVVKLGDGSLCETIGIAASGAGSKSWEEFNNQFLDFVVSVSEKAEQTSHAFPGQVASDKIRGERRRLFGSWLRLTRKYDLSNRFC